MIVGAVFVPSTPLLVPVVASGAAAELDDVRDASLGALRSQLAGSPDRVVIIGAGSTTRVHNRGTGSLRGFGVEVEVALDPAAGSASVLPLALTIGAWLLDRAGWTGERRALEVDASAPDASLDLAGSALATEAGRTVLLVVADGSAARTEKAPASLHPGAAAFDATVAAALASGSPASLAALDPVVAQEVSAAGRPAWRAAAAALEPRPAGEVTAYDAELLADVAPYGVGYLVARWTRA